MRIIAGSLRGLKLKTPKGMTTRPTSDRVKESLFNILGTRVYHAKVLDLFAGTGNLGLEALSRGALQAVFVDRVTANLIHKNLVKTRLEAKARVFSQDVEQVLKRLANKGEIFDLLFADPPYHQGLAERTLTILAAHPALLSTSGLCMIEHEGEKVLPEAVGAWKKTRVRGYGKTTAISFYAQRTEIEEETR